MENESENCSKREKSLKRRNSTRLVDVLDSKPARLLPKLFAQLYRLLLFFIPKQIRIYVGKLLAVFQAKILFKRLGLTRATSKYFNYVIADKEILTIDGVSLKTTHLSPVRDDGLKHPCIIIRTPYYRYFDFVLGVHYVHKGYHVLLQDVRGRFESGGDLTLGDYEKSDSSCTLKWLSEQPWSDKSAGVIGLSMVGYTCWTTYTSSIETYEEHGVQVKAVMPIISSSSIVKDGVYAHNFTKPVPDPVLKLSLMTRYVALTHELGAPRTFFGSNVPWIVMKVLSLFHEMRGKEWDKKYMHLPLNSIDLVAVDDVPSPRMDILTDPNHEFFQTLDNIRSVELLGKGFIPDKETGTPPHGCFISIAQKHAKGNEKKRLTLIMGDWRHLDDYFTVCLRESCRLFDRSLLGLEEEAEEETYLPVRVICVGAKGYFRTQRPLWEQALAQINPSTSSYSISNEKHHAWRQFSTWPPKEARKETLSMSAAKMLIPACDLEVNGQSSSALNAEINLQHYDSFIWSPYEPTPTLGGRLLCLDAGMKEQSSIIKRDDVLVYTSPPLKEMVEIAGDVHLNVFAASSATSMDIFAKLCIVLPGNFKETTLNLCEGINRYTLDTGENSCDQWPKKIRVSLGPICAQFNIGTKIRLIVSGGSFPQFSRNLGYGDPTPTAVRMKAAKHKLLWAGSALELPVTSTHSLEDALSSSNQNQAERILNRSK